MAEQKNVQLKTVIRDFEEEIAKLKIFKAFSDLKDILESIESFRKENEKEENKGGDDEGKKALKKAKL